MFLQIEWNYWTLKLVKASRDEKDPSILLQSRRKRLFSLQSVGQF